MKMRSNSSSAELFSSALAAKGEAVFVEMIGAMILCLKIRGTPDSNSLLRALEEAHRIAGMEMTAPRLAPGSVPRNK